LPGEEITHEGDLGRATYFRRAFKELKSIKKDSDEDHCKAVLKNITTKLSKFKRNNDDNI